MTRGSRLVIACACALLASACVVGPRYGAPATPPSAQGNFVSDHSAALAGAQPLPAHWWRLYEDPVLDQMVEEALVENQDLKVAAANLLYAQGLLREARDQRYPTTDLTAGVDYGRSSLALLTRSPAATFLSYGLASSYQLDLFGRLRRTIEAARANAQANQAAEDVTRVTVAAQTAGAYANICGYAEQVAVAQSSLALFQRTYDLFLVQRRAGALSDFDLDREAVLLQQAQAAIPPLEGQRRVALFTLAALIGKTPAEVPPEAAACKTPPRLKAPIPIGDGAALLRRRPDLREAERNLAAATARIGVATADLYPTVSLGGSFNAASTTLGGLGSINNATYSVGPLLTWSFPNILIARDHIRETSAQASAALATFDGAVLTALSETEQGLTAYAAELDHHVALVAAQTAANDALRLSRFQFRTGTFSILDILTVQETAVAANQAVAVSDQALIADQITLFQDLGGGWEDAPPVTAPAIPKR